MAETSDGQSTQATSDSPVPIAIPSDPPPIPVVHPLPTISLPNSVVTWISGMGRYAKGWVAFGVAAVGGAVAQGLIVGATAAWLSVVVGALATVGVVAKANTPPPSSTPSD